MTIEEAKEQIKNAMIAYFTKNSFGKYQIPPKKQRPIFLMGPPGIGKTDIIEQIAQEMGVGLVSYSMTHHTRQSAIGLPVISGKVYGGRSYEVSEYTMSEIIAAVYDMIEETGHREGILFLDEINCVSETLAPAMLQFLQFKTFGRHAVPEGWIVVTAGNPPEYNNSVREFDIVTSDRLKRIDVEPDFEVWKAYAYKKGVHPAILTFLEIHKNCFYKIETTAEGRSFVTARGWSDLADMILLYEAHGMTVDGKLISQYLRIDRIAREFAAYYELFRKYRSDYQIEAILEGDPAEEILERAKRAPFDERLSLIGLLLDSLTGDLRDVCRRELTMQTLLEDMKAVREAVNEGDTDPFAAIGERLQAKASRLEKEKMSSSLSEDEEYALDASGLILKDMQDSLSLPYAADSGSAMSVLKEKYDAGLAELRDLSAQTGDKLSHAFAFLEKVFPEGREMLIFVTELTVNYYGARFISRYGCEAYFRHNRDLLFYERKKELASEIDKVKPLL